MGPPLGQTLVIFILSFYELKWFEQCLREFKSAFYRRFVDDIIYWVYGQLSLVRVRVWFRVRIEIRLEAIFLGGNCPRTVLLVFESAEHLSNFYAYFNTCHPTTYFSFDKNKVVSYRFWK